MRRFGRRAGTVVAVCVAGLTASTTAGAAQPIGETFDPSSGGTCTPAPRTFLQTGSPPAGAPYTATNRGVITSWSYQAASLPPQIRIKVARPAGGNAFTIVGQSDIKTPTAGQLNTYSDRIPILTGDVIGLTILTEGECFRNSAGYEWRALNGDPQPGSTDTYNVEAPGIQFDIAALIEPDCDEDGLGDETQDPSLFGGSCPARGRFVRLDANKNKVRKGKKVTLTGSITEQARAGECQGGQTVQVQRKKPSQTSFTTFTQLQTDAQGSFSLKKKVKKTFEYRAQVVETATCTSALSNTEKVKVKKKR